MPTLQELTSSQVDEALRGAAQRCVPLGVTVRLGNSWRSLSSRLLVVRGDHMLIALPEGDDGWPSQELAPGEKIGLSFKLKHHKHLFGVTVKGPAKIALDDATEVPVLSVTRPNRIQRLQRRAYTRVEVPPNRIVRASFWLGGREAEPSGTSPEAPVWSGQVKNLSAGGFQFVPSSRSAVGATEVGDLVGVRIVFGAGQEAVYADAQFRHAEEIDGELAMGFQFVGLGQTDQGRSALQLISQKVSEYQHIHEQAAEAIAGGRRRSRA